MAIMKKIIKTLLSGLTMMLMLSVKTVYATEYDLNNYTYSHLENWDTTFVIDYYNSDVLEVVRNISKKNDYLMMSIKKLTYEKKGNKATLKVTYLTTKEEEAFINNELTRIINSIITNNLNDLDKIKVINKYIIDRYQYDNSFLSNNVYSALTTGKATCQSYSMTAYKMLNMAGIENKIVVGELHGIPHGWNLVKLNGKWYHLDVTNNDSLNNKFFLKNDDTLKTYGFNWNINNYPICDRNYEDNLNSFEPNLDGNLYFNNGVCYLFKKDNAYVTVWNITDNNYGYILMKNGTNTIQLANIWQLLRLLLGIKLIKI